MGSKAQTQVAKPESSPQAGTRSNILQRQRTALLEPDDTKETALSGYDEFRDSAPSVPNNPTLGHNFGRVSVFPPARAPIQPKLRVSEPNDIYEQQADRVADTMMRMPGTVAQRQSRAETEEEVRPQRQETARREVNEEEQRQEAEGSEQALLRRAFETERQNLERDLGEPIFQRNNLLFSAKDVEYLKFNAGGGSYSCSFIRPGMIDFSHGPNILSPTGYETINRDVAWLIKGGVDYLTIADYEHIRDQGYDPAIYVGTCLERWEDPASWEYGFIQTVEYMRWKASYTNFWDTLKSASDARDAVGENVSEPWYGHPGSAGGPVPLMNTPLTPVLEDSPASTYPLTHEEATCANHARIESEGKEHRGNCR